MASEWPSCNGFVCRAQVGPISQEWGCSEASSPHLSQDFEASQHQEMQHTPPCHSPRCSHCSFSMESELGTLQQLSGKIFIFLFFFCNFPLSSTFPSGPSITSDFIASSNCFSEVQVQYYSGILWNNFLSCCNPVHLVLLPLLISSIVHCFSFWCVNTKAEALHFGLSAKQIGECCLQ